MNLAELFDLSFRGRRDSPGLQCAGPEGRLDTYTFGELDARSNQMARLLQDRGLRAGDRLCVYLPNSLELIDLYLACVKLGVVFVPINILYRERELAHLLTDADPSAVVAAGSLAAGLSVWQASDLEREAAALPAERLPVALEGEAPAAIAYTSGATGAAKGAVLTHHNFAANALNLVTCWKVSSADRFLLCLPLFHVHGLGNGLPAWLLSGCRMRLLERFDRRTAAETFLAFRPTLFFGVPAIYERLLEIPEEAARRIGGFMRLFVSGSAPLPARALEQFQARFGHVILERYGMTETLMNISNPYVGERRPGSVGRPLPGVSIRLVEGDGRPVPEAGIGEVQVRGPNVFAGYWRREEATRAAFDGGWFRTGDLASRSADGYYTLHGRLDDLILSGGFNIDPREIEEFLQEQEGVAEAAVIGAPDRVRGQAPVAYIVPQGSFDAAELEARCRRSLASFKVPRAFIAVEQLPRTVLGKLQRRLLMKPETAS